MNSFQRINYKSILIPVLRLGSSCHPHRSLCTAAPSEDLEKLFIRRDVQIMLHQLTGFNTNVIFGPKPVPYLASPRYVFMTDDELKMAVSGASERGRRQLVMVPYKNPVESEDGQVLSRDPEIQGFEKSKLVFTDISSGANDRNRLIVVREPNGTLRRANRDERYRMNQIYYPQEDRLLDTPKMFQEENLRPILERGDYLFILERACLQFEPDDPQFVSITHETYDHLNEAKAFDCLKSTRHFGPLVFHLCINHKIDLLLQHYIHSLNMNDAKLLIQLYYLIHPSKLSDASLFEKDDLQIIQCYIEKSSGKRHLLELSLQTLKQKFRKDRMEERQ